MPNAQAPLTRGQAQLLPNRHGLAVGPGSHTVFQSVGRAQVTTSPAVIDVPGALVGDHVFLSWEQADIGIAPVGVAEPMLVLFHSIVLRGEERGV